MEAYRCEATPKAKQSSWGIGTSEKSVLQTFAVQQLAIFRACKTCAAFDPWHFPLAQLPRHLCTWSSIGR